MHGIRDSSDAANGVKFVPHRPIFSTPLGGATQVVLHDDGAQISVNERR